MLIRTININNGLLAVGAGWRPLLFVVLIVVFFVFFYPADW